MIAAGVDIGSTTTKAVLMDETSVVSHAIISSGVSPSEAAREVLDTACTRAGISSDDVNEIMSTGYGRKMAELGSSDLTEIKACAKGSIYAGKHFAPLRTVVDVGGQDTKVVVLDDQGTVTDFQMNDKCAAGTGRFLEVLTDKLELSYEEFVEKALQSDTMIQINSTCAVFAESEVVSLLNRGTGKEEIAAAVHNSIAERIAAMVRRAGGTDNFLFVGGGARNKALVRALSRTLGHELYVPENPQLVIALGAALEARQKI